MIKTLRILYLEDSLDDFDLANRLLLKDKLSFEMIRVETREQFSEKLNLEFFNLILSDYRLPGMTGLEALAIVQTTRPEIPFILLSGMMGEDIAIESIQKGATDYILKDRMGRLPSSIRRALAEAQDRSFFKQMHVRLQEARQLEAIGTLSQGIAHDFNNILAIIQGQASLLSLKQAGQFRQETQIISKAIQRGSKIVQELMAFANQAESPKTSIELNDHIHEIVTRNAASLPQHIRISFSLAQNLPSIFANLSQMEDIVVRLIDNAVETMPKGGDITVSTSFVPAELASRIPLALSEINYVSLFVTDTGAGMEESIRDHIFDPFYTTKERRQGTGLGLPVVYGLMQSHGGLVDIQSEPGHGTTVCLYFPVVEPPTPVKAATDRLPDPTMRGSGTILVVEDEPHVCSFIETILQNYGYRVLAAHNYDEALALFSANRNEVQLVFSDIGLPKVDGITLCTELTKLRPELRIIIYSGYSYQEFKGRLQTLGIRAFLPKPSNVHDIVKAIREVLTDVST
jgi:two-component system cell cycle sensor histidine kinase/response regulator CckA